MADELKFDLDDLDGTNLFLVQVRGQSEAIDAPCGPLYTSPSRKQRFTLRSEPGLFISLRYLLFQTRTVLLSRNCDLEERTHTVLHYCHSHWGRTLIIIILHERSETNSSQRTSTIHGHNEPN